MDCSRLKPETLSRLSRGERNFGIRLFILYHRIKKERESGGGGGGGGGGGEDKKTVNAEGID